MLLLRLLIHYDYLSCGYLVNYANTPLPNKPTCFLNCNNQFCPHFILVIFTYLNYPLANFLLI